MIFVYARRGNECDVLGDNDRRWRKQGEVETKAYRSVGLETSGDNGQVDLISSSQPLTVEL